MMLVLNAYGGADEGEGADFIAVLVTPAFMQALKARQRLAQSLHGRDGAVDLDSLLFHECSPQWLTWTEELEELLHVTEATGWVLLDEHRIAIADPAADTDLPRAIRTDCNQAVILFDPAGTARCLYSELLDLRRLGRLHLRRATRIEFNEDTQLWDVLPANGATTALFSAPTRSECLAWEQTNITP